jgi:hypothetical protein
MFLFEWFSWKSKTSQYCRLEDMSKKAGLYSKESMPYESEITQDQQASKLSVSKTPISRGPIYRYNESFVEMRCGMFEAHRGYITIISLIFFVFIGRLTYGIFEFIVSGPPFYSDNKPENNGVSIFLILLFSSINFFAIFIYFRYGLFLSRLEIFTSRHLLIRFNRKTQQVYLHRPKSCGGIAVLPWEGIISEGASITSDETSGLNVSLLLVWPSNVTKALHSEIVAVGRRGNSMSELRNEWEFIRRFMDEGPESLPRPHITSHFPWPWQAFVAPLEGLGQYLVNSNKTIKWGMFFLWPAIFVFGFAHWISLLLCWKPRWPKVIREAGLPGKPVPPLTTLEDFPPHIQQRLRDNAHLWAAKPGSPPEKKPRKPRAKRKPQAAQADVEQ